MTPSNDTRPHSVHVTQEQSRRSFLANCVIGFPGLFTLAAISGTVGDNVLLNLVNSSTNPESTTLPLQVSDQVKHLIHATERLLDLGRQDLSRANTNQSEALKNLEAAKADTWLSMKPFSDTAHTSPFSDRDFLLALQETSKTLINHGVYFAVRTNKDDSALQDLSFFKIDEIASHEANYWGNHVRALVYMIGKPLSFNPTMPITSGDYRKPHIYVMRDQLTTSVQAINKGAFYSTPRESSHPIDLAISHCTDQLDTSFQANPLSRGELEDSVIAHETGHHHFQLSSMYPWMWRNVVGEGGGNPSRSLNVKVHSEIVAQLAEMRYSKRSDLALRTFLSNFHQKEAGEYHSVAALWILDQMIQEIRSYPTIYGSVIADRSTSASIVSQLHKLTDHKSLGSGKLFNELIDTLYLKHTSLVRSLTFQKEGATLSEFHDFSLPEVFAGTLFGVGVADYCFSENNHRFRFPI